MDDISSKMAGSPGGEQAAYGTCRLPSRVLIVVPYQCLDAPVGWQVCLPQGPIRAYTVNGPSGQLTLPPSALVIPHGRTFHAYDEAMRTVLGPLFLGFQE